MNHIADIALLAFLAAFAIGFYFLPSFIAWKRDHQQFAVIVFLNLVLPGIGWIIGMAMALSAVDGSDHR